MASLVGVVAAIHIIKFYELIILIIIGVIMILSYMTGSARCRGFYSGQTQHACAI